MNKSPKKTKIIQLSQNTNSRALEVLFEELVKLEQQIAKEIQKEPLPN